MTLELDALDRDWVEIADKDNTGDVIAPAPAHQQTGWLVTFTCPHCGEETAIVYRYKTPGAAEDGRWRMEGAGLDWNIRTLAYCIDRGLLSEGALAHLGLAPLPEVA